MILAFILSATVAGIVGEKGTGILLSNASIYINNKLVAKSDINGFFTLTQIDTGEYIFTVKLKGYKEFSQKIKIKEGMNNIVIPLEKIKTKLPYRLKRVAIIISKKIKAYEEMKKGFESTCAGEFDEFTLQNGKIPKFNPEKYDLLCAIGTDAVNAIKKYEKPKIFIGVLNPSNELKKYKFTGVSINIDYGEIIRATKNLLPYMKKVCIIYKDINPDLIKEIKNAKDIVGFELVEYKVKDLKEAKKILNRINDIDVYVMMPDELNLSSKYFDYLLKKSYEKGFHIVGLSEKFVAKGGSFCLWVDMEDMGRQAGELANEILLAETKPEELPFEKVRKTKLIINLKTFKKLNTKIPEIFIKKAYKIY